MGVYFDDGVFDEERLVYIRICHQLIQIDTGGMQQLLLFHIFGTVCIKVYFGLLIVETGEVTDVIAFFHDAEPFFRQFYGIVQIGETYFLLDKVIVFCGKAGHKVFDGYTGICFAL